MGGSVLSRCVDYLDALLADKYTRHVSIEVMKHAADLDLVTYEDPVFYDRLERARVQATDRLGMVQAIGRLVQQVITAGTLSISIFLFSPWLLLLLVAGIVPAFLGESHFAFLGYARNFRQTPIRRELDYLRAARREPGSSQGAEAIRSEELPGRTVHQALGPDLQRECRPGTPAAGCRLFLSMIGTAGYYGAYVLVIWWTVKGRLSIGTLTFLTGAIVQASGNIQQIFSTLAGIADQALFLTDLLAFFEMKPTIQSKPNALPAPRPMVRGFEFRNVSFRYPGNSRAVLNGLNFHLHPGERVALIGENGQGKTTIVKLLTRLYDPVEGQVLLDGVRLREYDLDDLYKEIGVIFQDFMRYEMTARENIAVGQIQDLENHGPLEMAAAKSMADEVVRRLPRQYDQMLGRRFEGGVDLSGGEWQKVALARAYLRQRHLVLPCPFSPNGDATLAPSARVPVAHLATTGSSLHLEERQQVGEDSAWSAMPARVEKTPECCRWPARSRRSERSAYQCSACPLPSTRSRAHRRRGIPRGRSWTRKSPCRTSRRRARSTFSL